jgi:hypothetical protein
MAAESLCQSILRRDPTAPRVGHNFPAILIYLSYCDSSADERSLLLFSTLGNWGLKKYW